MLAAEVLQQLDELLLAGPAEVSEQRHSGRRLPSSPLATASPRRRAGAWQASRPGYCAREVLATDLVSRDGQGQMDGGREEERETDGRRDRGTEGQRDRGTEGQRERETEGGTNTCTYTCV